jgi:CelD/BcsL family acetyltransferase involved in cellulose biosynthesis
MTNLITASSAAPAQAIAAAPAPALHVETVSSYKEFLDLEEQWDELVRAAGVDHPFLHHAWARTWWECFGAGSTLHILVVKAGGRIVAIAPLILTPVRMWGVRVRRLGFFYNAHVPRAEFIVAERRPEAYRAIWTHLAKNRCWDVLQLCQLPEGSETLQEISRLAASSRYPTGLWQSGESPFVSLDTSWDEYFSELPAKHRSNLRNRFKRLGQAGPLEVEAIASESGLTDALGDALQLEAAAWKRDAGTAIACDPGITRFYMTYAQRAADRGWLRLHFLRAGSARVAFDYSLFYANRLFLLKLGYDPAYAPYSPSNLLLSRVVEGAFEQRLSRYDFLGETADWKRCWTSESLPHFWLFVFSNSLKGRFLHRVKFGLIPLLKSNRLAPVRRLVQRIPALANKGNG